MVFKDLYNMRRVDRCKNLMRRFYERYYGTSDTSVKLVLNKSKKAAIVTFCARNNLILFYVFMIGLFSFRFKVTKKGDFFWSLFWSAGSTVLYSVILQTVALIFQVLSPQIFR